MAQIHCYIPDEIASQLGKKAEEKHLSSGWPSGYFEQVFGGWEGDEPLQRSKQDEYEIREEFE